MSAFIRQQKEATIQAFALISRLSTVAKKFVADAGVHCEHHSKTASNVCSHPDYTHPARALMGALWDKPINQCNPRNCPYGK